MHAGDGMVVDLVRVVDGDTIVVNIHGWPDIVGREIGVRVSGCDTPELRDRRPEVKALAYRAKRVVTDVLFNAGIVTLHNIRRGKYFRLVADVYADDICISSFLIHAGLALPYDGGKKRPMAISGNARLIKAFHRK